MKLKLNLKDKILKPRRWTEKIKENKEVAVIIIMFMLLSFIVFLSEVLDLPHYLLGAPQTLINWREALFLIILIVFVGILAIAIVLRFVRKDKQTMKAITHEQYLLHALMNNISDSIYFKDKENRFVMVNRAKAEHSGMAPKDMIGKTDFDFLPQEIAKQSFTDDNHIMESGRSTVDKTEEIIHLNKIKHWVSVTKVPWYDEEGKIIGTIGIIRDITERKKAEEALLKSQQEFVSLFNSSPQAAIYHDEKGIILNINPRFTELFGYTLEEVKGKNINQGMIFPKGKTVEESERLTKLALEGSIVEYETIRKKKDGTLIPVIISTSSVIAKEQNKGIIAFYQDITERKKVEETLRKSQQEFASLFNSSPEALVYLDEKGNILNINPRFTELFGYTLEEVKGRNFDDGMIHPPDKIEEGKRLTEKGLKGDLYYETIRKKKDGTLFPVYISGSRVMLDGKLQGVMAMYKDITERKRNEELNKVLYNISKAANSALSLDQLYPLIHQELGSIIDTTNFYIALVDEKEDKIFFPYHVDEKDDNFPIINFSTANTLTAYVIKNGQPLLNDNNQYKEMIDQGILSPWGSTTDKSIWLGVPLKIEDKTIGAMVVQSYTNPELYSEKDIGLLEFVSSQVATALERKRTEEKIRYLSFHDALTDLYNRAYFEEELERYNFPRRYPLSVIMIDINGLKVVNDTFGHDQGDKLLQHLAALLNSISRKGDVVARLGGDEFVILLPSTTAEQAHDFHERIKKTCEEDNIKPIYLRPSIALGCVTQKGEYQNTETLLKEVDKRMYQDKNITR